MLLKNFGAPEPVWTTRAGTRVAPPGVNSGRHHDRIVVRAASSRAWLDLAAVSPYGFSAGIDMPGALRGMHARFLLMCGWRGNRRRLAHIRVLNLAGVQGQLVLENDVERGPARKFCFGAAREQDGAESR